MARNGKNVPAAVMLRSADWQDILLMLFGAFAAIGDGLTRSCVMIYFVPLFNTLGNGKTTTTQQNHLYFMAVIEKCSLYISYLGLVFWVVGFIEGYCWSKTSERQVSRLRYKYLEAILKQEVGFFDSQEATTSEIIESISKDSSLLQEVLGEKLPSFLMHTTAFVSGLCFSAYFSWRLTLVAFPTTVLLILPGLIYKRYLAYLCQKSATEYGKANAVAAQALSSVKTVYSFTAEKRILGKYSSVLDSTTKLGIKQGIAKGLAVGCAKLSFLVMALLAWYGSRLVMYKGETGGTIYAASVCITMGGLSLGMAISEVKYFSEATVALSRISQRMKRIPEIDSNSTEGIQLHNIKGDLEFERVHFAYPSRPDTVVLKDFSLKIEAGKTLALVGASGSGKSTAIALVQRFYDANGGVILVDGVDIKTLQLKWLRSHMGLVTQDNALFGTTIRENIVFAKHDATMDEVVAASIAANAHDFIRQLPDGYQTKVGEQGALLSGGQKQRIAIARAILRNPVILLLDEATSSVDSESEMIVQNALDQASRGRTTLVVAHKIATVRNADLIAATSSGCIIETGSHNELIHKNGHYAEMAKIQREFRSVEQEHNLEKAYNSSVERRSSSRPAASALIQRFDITPKAGPDDQACSSTTYRLLLMSLPEWKQGVIGSLSAIAFGAVLPLFLLTLGEMVSALFSPTHDEIRARIRTCCAIFSLFFVVSFVVSLFQHYNFSYVGEHLTKRIRLKLLEKILTFEPAWFDEEENSSGVLCSKLSSEASLVKSLVADRHSLLIETISIMVISMVTGLVIAWKFAIVLIAVQPITILCFYTRRVLLQSITSKAAKSQHCSTQIAVEAVRNHKIVASYGGTQKILQIFDAAQNEAGKGAGKKSFLAGVGIGSAKCLTCFSYAFSFWYGGKLVNSGIISSADFFKTFFMVLNTGHHIAEAGSMTSALTKGAAAVASIFAILDRKSLISGSDTARTEMKDLTGWIEMKNVGFSYPGRREIRVLNGFNLDLKPGTSTGLVGKSGCGKSTVISLIQRFYDVTEGTVKVDQEDIRLLELEWYRKQMALVSQEPVIYSGSIRDNILFGKPDARENEVVDAARAANAHEFISALENGYETECGERGVQLSGGQKQRIAIARAIIRNPSILLLDEATSALDMQSEKVVQEAMDRIMEGRTTVVVAHRLNAVKNLDSIAFVSDGKVVEQGSYGQLKNKRGAFFNLLNLQDV